MLKRGKGQRVSPLHAGPTDSDEQRSALQEQRCKSMSVAGILDNSGVVRIDDLLVGRVGVQALLQKALRLVDERTHREHLWLDGVAKVLGLGLQVMGLLVEEGLQLVRLGLDSRVGGLALPSQLWHRCEFGHVLGASWENAGL